MVFTLFYKINDETGSQNVIDLKGENQFSQ